MELRNTPIRRRLMIMLLVTSGAVLALTCAAFILYQYQGYRAVDAAYRRDARRGHSKQQHGGARFRQRL